MRIMHSMNPKAEKSDTSSPKKEKPMSKPFNAQVVHDVHDAANRARDIRGAYMAQSLSGLSLGGLSLNAMVKSSLIKSALGTLAAKAPQAGHRA